MCREQAITYRVIQSDRHTVAIQITRQGEVLVRCPRSMRRDAIQAFVESKSHWINKHLDRQITQPKPSVLSEAELQQLAKQARKLFLERVKHFAPLTGVDYGRITIRHQRTRWGSCSLKGNLNFNCLLLLAPPAVLDYVVVHELCHRKEMNHSQRFWTQVERILPDYRESRKWLQENGAGLMSRLSK